MSKKAEKEIMKNIIEAINRCCSHTMKELQIWLWYRNPCVAAYLNQTDMECIAQKNFK